jgi:phosphatidate cytidylyltransferase
MASSPAPTKKASRAGRDLPAAIAVGVGLLAYIWVTLAWFHWGFIILVAVALSLGAIEVHQALKRIGMHSAIVPIVLGTLGMILGTYAAALGLGGTGIPWHAVQLAFLGAMVLASMAWRMRGGHEGFVHDTAGSLFIISYIGLLGSFAALILAGDHGAARMVTFLMCVVGNDTGGYAVGVLFGRHPMAPTISPKKTWEGFAGSVFFSIVVGSIVGMIALRAPWWVGAVLGLVLAFFATAGDLIESLIKRDVGIKDMSSFLPGHGGMMDRLDSMLVAAPAAWLVLYLLVPGG